MLTGQEIEQTISKRLLFFNMNATSINSNKANSNKTINVS